MNAITSLAQQRTVSGRVTDASTGQALPGVNVVVKGTTTGTSTDMDGTFVLSLNEPSTVLSFSFIGYVTQEVAVGERSMVDISMTNDAIFLSEIVVTGTGVPTEKRKLAFSVETVNGESLPIVPTAGIDQALVGKVPGALISPINGTPGAEVSIVLRGINTINRGTMPMILVDGIQMAATTLSSLDPVTIESVEVIQGAAAATIYGAQGANGVIQIFTRKGKQGKVKIDFTSGLSRNEFLNTGNLRKASLHGFLTNANNEVINPGDSIPLQQDPATLLYNGNVSTTLLDSNTQFNKPYNRNLQYYDHLKMFYEPAYIYTNSLRISGGSENMDYAIAVSNMHHQSNFKSDGYNDRTNLLANIGVGLAKDLKFRTITQLIYTRNTVNIWEKQNYRINGNSWYVFNARPFANFALKDNDGNYGVYFGSAAGENQFNPFYENQYASTTDIKTDILQNFSLAFSPLRFIDLDVIYGINMQDGDVRHVVENQSQNQNSSVTNAGTFYRNFADNTGEITSFQNRRTFQNFKTNARVSLDFERDLHWSVPLKSVTQVTYDYRNDALHKYASTGLGMPLVPPLTATQGGNFSVFEDYIEKFVTYGYLVSQHFLFSETAGISGGFRTDYSSAFGRGSKPFTFPRADGFFRISGLNAWDGTSISSLIFEWKIRGAYGEAGIQPLPFDRYVTLSSRTIGNSNVFYFGTEQSNPDLGVEVSRELELGSDIMLNGFHGQWLRNFQFSVTYWKRSTNNAIFNVDAPPSLGIGTIKDNVLSLESKGIQASLVTTVFKGSKLNWHFTTNFGQQESIITKVKGDRIIVRNNVLEAGQEVGQFFGKMLLHAVDQRSPAGESFIEPALQENYEVASNGWVVNRLTKQPFISPDRYPLGDPNPTFNMSFIHNLSYKKFLTFSFQLDWVYGSKLYNMVRHWMYRDGIHSDYEMPITVNGETGAWSAFYNGAYDLRQENNYFIEDASFLRLRNIALAFDLARLLDLSKFDRIQLVLSGRNLWTRTRYTGMDPEISTYGALASALDRGRDNGSVPNFKSYQLSLNIGL
ncbi:MAG: SusC/RagA family TonB-linked outer membrane protein [Cyclobacteriaceae bacterium]